MSRPRVDFLAPRTASAWGWGLLALGAAALGFALHIDRRWSDERVQQEAALQARAAQSEQRRREATQPLPVSPDQLRLQRVAPQLRQPWLPVLRVVEGATRAPVFLLALSVDPASGWIRIEGEAPTFDKALEYARSLDQEGLLGPAQLRSHEQTVDEAGRTAVRFVIATPWSAR